MNPRREVVVSEGKSAAYARRPSHIGVGSTSWKHTPGSVRHRASGADASVSQPDDGSIVGGRSKRCFDVVTVTCAILLLVPLFLLIALAIKFSDRGPVLFRHRRVGRNGRSFYCFKFRTMAVDSEFVLQRHLAENPEAAREWSADHKLKDDPRVTALGHALRKTSLDELPQLINILKGEMSLVGPRPIVDAEIPKYAAAISQYYCARPGLTGPWQVSGRNDVDYSRRVAFDKQYVEQWSFGRDLAIIAKTFRVVITGKGCY